MVVTGVPIFFVTGMTRPVKIPTAQARKLSTKAKIQMCLCSPRGKVSSYPQIFAWWSPDFSEKTQTEVARACHTIIWTGKDYPTWNSSRRKTKRQTEETMGRQHQSGLTLNGIYTTTESREPRGVEEAGCKIYSGAPTVSKTTGSIG